MSISGSRPRSATTRTTSRHWSSLRSAPVGLWQQPWSRATSPGSRALPAPRSCPRSGSPPARARNRDIRLVPSPTAWMIGGWFGQVGVPTNTRAPGLTVAISSNPRRSAPQPPGVCSPASARRRHVDPAGSAAATRRSACRPRCRDRPWFPGVSSRRCSASFITFRIGVLPAPSRKTPTPTSILSGRGSALTMRDQRDQRIARLRVEDRRGLSPSRASASAWQRD